MYRPLAISVCLVVLCGCGGVTTGPSSSASSTTPGTPSGNSLPTPAVVNVAAGQSSSGVDITVASPASSPAPNAQFLGVSPITGTATASNTGDVIHRGSTQRIVLFGQGLTGDMSAEIRGPNDVTPITSPQAIMATDGTPGVQFTVTVGSTATLGCRTVVLTRPNGDVTTFAGGLEVVP
ncbi:MAG: hypothetical protein JO041_16655 [Acidobacteria bacterium]|nr:hypothetical protein [Acidobacteriota bacterium]